MTIAICKTKKCTNPIFVSSESSQFCDLCMVRKHERNKKIHAMCMEYYDSHPMFSEDERFIFECGVTQALEYLDITEEIKLNKYEH